MNNIYSVISLGDVLKHQLEKANKFYVATALMNDYGLNLLKKAPDFCEIKLLVGIDLPTPWNVFELLLKNSSVNLRIYQNSKETFHPKVYLLQVGSQWKVYVGSANFTEGGFESNVEMTIASTDEECITQLLNWFEAIFNRGKKIDQDWLNSYKTYITEVSELNAKKRDLLKRFKNNFIGTDSPSNYDFTGQFFQYEHHNAFSGKKPRDRSSDTVKERGKVADKLFELHQKLYPVIRSKNWRIEPHYQDQHIISSIEHGEFTSDELRSVWLSYNRPKNEVKRLIRDFGETQTPLYQMRLQVLVHLDDIAVHLTVGKDKRGGWRERGNIQNFIDEQGNEKLNEFHSLLSGLPASFYINVADDPVSADSFDTPRDLKKYLSKDDINKYYFIIGRVYPPDDERISEGEIVSTIIGDFEKLIPIYQLLTVPAI